MNVLTDIFAEYINKRLSGLEKEQTLDMLRSYIGDLTKQERQDLAGYIRRWESKRTADNLPTGNRSTTQELPINADNRRSTTTVRSLREMGAPQSTTLPSIERKDATSTNEMPLVTPQQEEKVKCSNCGKLNAKNEVICYSCGFMLDEAAARFGTRQFMEQGGGGLEYQRFGKTSTLILRLKDSNHQFELRPQLFAHEIIVGRSAKGSSMVPDVDLIDYGGDRLGVSRLHLAIKYERKDDAIQVYDLGSSNGSYLNGQRLHPKEIRVLADGDDVRLGQLSMTVTFQQHNSRTRITGLTPE